MPSEVKTYLCNHCKQSYANIVLAEKCESSHIPIRDYTPIYIGKASKYPDQIDVTFDDRQTVSYYKQES